MRSRIWARGWQADLLNPGLSGKVEASIVDFVVVTLYHKFSRGADEKELDQTLVNMFI